MARLKLPNIYLKCGLVLLLAGVACAIALVVTLPPIGSRSHHLLMWGAQGGFFSGLVLYVIGRIAHAARHFRRT